jgi:hypothetical protein
MSCARRTPVRSATATCCSDAYSNTRFPMHVRDTQHICIHIHTNTHKLHGQQPSHALAHTQEAHKSWDQHMSQLHAFVTENASIPDMANLNLYQHAVRMLARAQMRDADKLLHIDDAELERTLASAQAEADKRGFAASMFQRAGKKLGIVLAFQNAVQTAKRDSMSSSEEDGAVVAARRRHRNVHSTATLESVKRRSRTSMPGRPSHSNTPDSDGHT